MREPKTPGEWQHAVDAAHSAQMLETARQFGIVKGGPEINIHRCEQILREGKKLGWLPRQQALDAFIREMARNFVQ